MSTTSSSDMSDISAQPKVNQSRPTKNYWILSIRRIMKMTDNKYPRCPHCGGDKFHYEGTFRIDAEWDESFGEMVFLDGTMTKSDSRLICFKCKEHVFEDDLMFEPRN